MSDEYNNDLREKSGTIKSNDPLVCFLYLLMRDHVPVGTITKIVTASIEDEEMVYTNGFLANFAKYTAEQLDAEYSNKEE